MLGLKNKIHTELQFKVVEGQRFCLFMKIIQEI